MSEEAQLPERPPLKHEVQLDDGGTHSVHMTYGLWNDFQRVMPDAGTVIESGLNDPYLRDYVTRRCFSDAKKMVEKEEDLIDVGEMPVSDPIELEKLQSWVAGHLLYFFGASAVATRKMGKTFSQVLKTPTAPSSNGSEA